MVIVMSTDAAEQDVQQVLDRLGEHGCRGELTVGVERTIITVVGPRPAALQEEIRTLPHVESVVLLSKSYERAGRESQPEGTVVAIGEARVGDGGIAIVAGPGAVESQAELLALAQSLKERGVTLLRGGAMRPSQSPYAFRGLGEEGLRYLAEAGGASGLGVVSEVPSVDNVAIVAAYVDVLEIGPFNMHNHGLLEAAAATGKPILLHRGLSATVDEWLLSAEYVLNAGNPQVILCESGIRTFDPTTPATLDVSAVPVLKELTHLPVIVDPAHSAGRADLVAPLALAAVAAGADGLAIHVHPQPGHALVDGAQSLGPEPYGELITRLRTLAAALERPLCFA